MNIGIIGLGFVGGAMYKSFKEKGVNVYGYDKFKESDSLEECLKCPILFLCLPTQFNESINSYDKSCIDEVLNYINNNNNNNIIVIKSTVEPLTTEGFQTKYSSLKFIHNPEFLTARTAFEDFHNQSHIVLGKSSNIMDNDLDLVKTFYKTYYPNAEISLCSCTESESMKIYLNCFYSVKVQFFNELYLLSNKMNCDYNVIKDLMLKNNWINPMHTNVPGPDGLLSYGGYCFPKDTNALLNHMKRLESPHMVLQATVNERNSMREDKTNIIIQ
jgi:UDPglucose 6-dehydrogenase